MATLALLDSDSYWEDRSRLNDRQGWRAQLLLLSAAHELSHVRNPQVSALAQRLAGQMRELVVVELADALADGGPTAWTQIAQHFLAHGDRAQERGYTSTASRHYSLAWTFANR